MGKRKGARDNVWHAREFILENPALMEYYVEQGVVRKEEMEAFAAAMRKPLGAALRLNPANPGLPECETARIHSLWDALTTCLASGAAQDGAPPARGLPVRGAAHYARDRRGV